MLLRILGIVLFVIVLFNVDLKSIWENIRQVSPLFFILGLLSQVALLLIKGWRWHIMNRGKQNIKSPVQSMGEFLESYAIGVITPGRLGELMKAGYQSDRAGVFASGLRVFAERGLDVGFFVIVAGAALGFAKPIPFPESLSFLIMGTGMVILIMAVLLIGNKQTTRFISRTFRKFSDNYSNLDLGDSLAVFILSIFSNAFAFLSCYFLA
ncbi:MAG: flippase-like domain-containing protein, partial [Bacteroidales bacterium]|nr:flippase-like domain-containing protein [Bacteroidales bacterium]